HLRDQFPDETRWRRGERPRDAELPAARRRGGGARWPSGGAGRMVAARHILDGDCDFLSFFANLSSTDSNWRRDNLHVQTYFQSSHLCYLQG
ncbi:unnamed protein product, partial [Urochloa humidicola]